jgi:tetratricopeptide (TPR) repeat protein
MCQNSANGRFSFLCDRGSPGKMGCFALVENSSPARLAQHGSAYHPEEGLVADNGIFTFSEYAEGLNPVKILRVHCPAQGQIFTHIFSVNYVNCNAISNDGRYVICSTGYYGSEEDDGNVFFFDVVEKRMLWKRKLESDLTFYECSIDSQSQTFTLNYDSPPENVGCIVYDFSGAMVDHSSFHGSLTNHALIAAVKNIRDFCMRHEEASPSRVAEAQVLFQKLKTLYPKALDKSEQFDIWMSLGNLMAALKMPEKAIESFNKAINVNPQEEDVVWRCVGEMHDTNGSLREAAEAYEKALLLNDAIGVKGKLKAVRSKLKKLVPEH